MPDTHQIAQLATELLRRPPRRLRPIERAACELALCVLRPPSKRPMFSVGAAEDALCTVARMRQHGLGDSPAATDLLVAIDAVAVDTPPRLLRARLALYLRALLRADRGDMWRQWRWVAPVGEVESDACTRETAESVARRHGGHVRRIRPLWEVTP